MIQTVISNEGQLPHHSIPEAWLLYNQVRGIDRGLFFQVGESWSKLRRAMNKVMLVDATKTRRFTDAIQTVNDDLFRSWLLNKSGGAHSDDGSFVVNDVKFDLCKWSIEATGVMLFGKRMGCVIGHEGSEDTRRAEDLVANVAAMFHETSTFQIVPPKLAQRLNLGSWQRFVAASDKMIELASQYAAEFIAKARQPESSESFTRDLLDLGSLDDGGISRSMVDLIIAAADTTSNSLQWMLYMLAKHPEAQSKIFAELRESTSNHNSRNDEPAIGTPYLSAFVKEVSRLYPTAPFLARTLDHEIALDGYKIPAGKPIVFSLYTTSRMDEYFADANKFKPERWLRAGRASSGSSIGEETNACPGRQPNHAYASLPFGIGARMCIGRRMADLEMHSLIASIVSRFEVRPANPNEKIKIKLKMILCPDKPISLLFKPR